MCRELAQMTDSDMKQNVIPRHNDESYLNAWSSKNEVRRLTPEWAFAEGYSNLRDLVPKIHVVHKPKEWVREPS
jgi:hypothetical protein